jgi:hypothetical protein
MAANAEGVNYKKFTHDTFNYGTPRIYPLVIQRSDEGDFADYADNNSDFYKVLNYIQGRGVEIYGLGTVVGNTFTILTNWEKVAKDEGDSQEPNDTRDIDLLQDEVLAGTGIEVRVWYGKILGGTLSWND